ncbi:DegT/DnrJ/EryC1/StrS family aminotransferase [Magnetospirillum gryphiswaldense]|uniref:DegT/DnrJ/EryC1/StrS family aminotransferase n=1 Tax=Magnetospirillum gryphiswaldense TaxID=55518 RepID=UPI0005A239D6|nr:DegT/DnrJ/EryC1/StrS aminotransferase family protein [Magnetospirillum gryphiswaldense]
MIPIIRPDLSYDEVTENLRAVIESGQLTCGRMVAEFESLVARTVGVKHAVATTSATTALHLALAAKGIGAGDEVLVSDFSFPASANAIIQTGAVPVFVDCRPGGFDLDVDDAVGKVTARTKAIMPVHPFGMPADVKAIAAMADRHGLFVVEDAACAIGAERDEIRCGGGPGVGCFSFHPRKLITTGEGGMVTTNDDALAARLRLLRSHGGQAGPKVGLEFVENGYNYRLSEIQAVLGIAQMKRLDAILADRRRTAALYRQGLAGWADVALPQFDVVGSGTFQSFVVMLGDNIDRDRVVGDMRQAGVETTLGTYAQHAHPAFIRFGYAAGALPHSWRAQRQSLTLPLLPRMDGETVSKVIDALRRVLEVSV